MPNQIQCSLTCDSCGLKEKKMVSYKPQIGFDVKNEWVTHSYTDFVQCRRCFEEADRKYKKYKEKTSSIKRFFAGKKWWYQFAKGHWAYKK